MNTESIDPAEPAGSGTAAALALHRGSVVVDGHVDTAGRCRDAGFDFMARNVSGHADYPRLREGGIGAAVMAVYFGRTAEPNSGGLAAQAKERIAWIRRLATDHPGELAIAGTAAETRAVAASGRIGLIVGIEGGHLIEQNLATLESFHALGARLLTLTHTFHHEWADSAGAGDPLSPRHGGLTRFGRSVVSLCNRLGMLVDVSHVAERTFWHALDASSAPVVASHSACRALCDHPRNLTDAMIRALAAQGGAIQIPFFPRFLDPAARSGGWEARPQCPLSAVVAHLEHAVEVAGPEHVGIGSDWDGIEVTAAGLEDCSCLPNLTAALLERGWSAAAVRKVLGENFLKVMSAAVDARSVRS